MHEINNSGHSVPFRSDRLKDFLGVIRPAKPPSRPFMSALLEPPLRGLVSHFSGTAHGSENVIVGVRIAVGPIPGARNRCRLRIDFSDQDANATHTLSPCSRPNFQLTKVPRTTALSCCPSRCSMTCFHGTRLNPMSSSSMAKRPLTGLTD